jgi:UDP-N-acetylglucosamine:LPS N-acetylglucosamine transferase
MVEELKILIINRKEQIFSRNATIVNILESLKSKTKVNELWILADSGKDISGYKSKPLEFNYKFFEDYKTDDVIEILEKEKPDVIFTLNDYEFVVRSFVLAAKFKKIPTILSLQSGFGEVYFERDIAIKSRFNILRQRGGFILKKYKLLLKTYRKTGYGFVKIIKIVMEDAIKPFLYSELAGRYGCDLILVVNQYMVDLLKNKGVRSKIVVTGDPVMDTIYDNISKYKKQDDLGSRIKVVLMTTATVEHGIWTKKMWEETIKQTVTTICKEFSNEIDLVLKIHPRSERIEDYTELLQKIGVHVPILQTENLMDVINNADIVISYAESWGLWEVLFLEKPIVIVNLFNYPVEKMPFVKEGVAYELKNMHEFRNLISKIKNEKHNKEKINMMISKYIFKFDNKSSERSALAILELLKDFKTHQ